MIKVGIGQDSHKFARQKSTKPLILGGVTFENEMSLLGNSDSDVVLHAITNAISGVSGTNILGEISDTMCRQGITDSKYYVLEALKTLGDYEVSHLSVSIECQKPMITPRVVDMKRSIASLVGIDEKDVGITATTGEGLTAFGRGEGIQVFSIVTASLK